MGTYLNPGKEYYVEAINSQIFVDKSDMIAYLNTLVKTKQKYVCVSRPRRFGKSMAADMVCAYYDRTADSRELFENLKLSKTEDSDEKAWDKYLGQFDVIRLVMTDFFKEGVSIDDALLKLTRRILDDLEETYPDVKNDPKDLPYSMEKYCQKSKRQFVLVIDEWDAVFRDCKSDTDGQNKYLDFLRDWLKDKAYVALAYMTGILPIKKYGKHSALNMFTEYSIIAPMQLASYTGFTDDEVKELCRQYGRDFGKMKEWYDGYELSDIIPPDPDYEYRDDIGKEIEPTRYSIYSPLSVVNAVITGYVQNYWNKTETYEALAHYISMNYEGLKDAVTLMMNGGCVKVDISTYQNDMTTFKSRDDVLALLINLGYLKYDSDYKEVSIPNREILDEFKASTKDSVWTDSFRAFEISMKLLEATWALDSEKIAELLEKVHDLAGNKSYNDEAALSYAIQYAYYAAQKYYTTILELDSGKGYADIVYIPSPKYPDKPVLLIELKYNKNAETAMSQIKKQKYPARLEHYRGNILLVGINYDKDVPNTSEEFKHHECVIERA